MATDDVIHSNLAIPPGEYLEEVLDDLGMSKTELARRMSRPATKLSPIFRGTKAITPDTALQLEKVVGVPAHIWTGLEAEYRLTLARQDEARHQQRLKEEARLVTAYCYADLVKAGEVQRHTRPADKALEMQKFFGVTTLKSVPTLRRYEAFFRSAASRRARRTPEAVAAWLRLGERRAQAVRCAAFSKAGLMGALEDVRSMTLEQPREFMETLRACLAGCGVALVVCPHFRRAKATGATFWLGSDTAVVVLTIRGRWRTTGNRAPSRHEKQRLTGSPPTR
jgi:HTH-type transcriptional regulator/antitoxin HigA